MKNLSLKLSEATAWLKNEWSKVKTDVTAGSLIVKGIASVNAGVTDPAEYAKNAATWMVQNQSVLPVSWQDSNLEKAVIKSLSDIETGNTLSELETIIKDVFVALKVVA